MVPSSYQTSLYAPLTAFFNSPIATAGEVLKSNIVLEEALRQLQKILPATECPSVDELRGGLSVVAVANADILQLRFRYKEPKVCQLSLDALLDAFIKQNSEQSSASATQSRLFLEKQLKKAREDNLKAREQLKLFQDENKAQDFTEQSSYNLRMMSDIEDQERKCQTSLSELQTKIGFLQGQLKMKPEDAVLAQRLALDDTIKELQTAIGTDEVKLIELRSKFKENHPRIQQLQMVLDHARNALHERVAALVGPEGLNRAITGKVYVTDSMQQKLMGEMVDAKADLLAAQTKLSSLISQKLAIKQDLNELPTQKLKLAELERAADVTKQILTDTERNLHSIRLLEAVASRASNIQVLDRPGPAMQTEQRQAFGFLVSVVLGTLLGGLTFYGIFLLNPAANRIKDVINLVPWPIMGWVNRLPAPVTDRDVLPGLEHLRANLRPWLSKGHVRIVVTSGDVEDGKTVLACGLAVSLSKAGLRVVLVDLNSLHASLHEVFETPQSPGLSEYLSWGDPSRLDSIVRRVKDNLCIVTAGVVANCQPALLIAGSSMRRWRGCNQDRTC